MFCLSCIKINIVKSNSYVYETKIFFKHYFYIWGMKKIFVSYAYELNFNTDFFSYLYIKIMFKKKIFFIRILNFNSYAYEANILI